MRDRQRWMSRLSWTFVFVGFHLLTTVQCSYTHRKVPQRKSRQAAAEEAIAGVWSSWGPWSSCSSSCGSGISQQSRRCLPREAEPEAGARGWAPSRPEEAEERWEAYPGRAVSALRRAYPLHVDAEAQPSTANRHALPLYGDARAAASQPGPSLYAPTNGEPPSLHLYRRPANRGSVPLYRQERPPNHGRAGRGPAGGARGSAGREPGSAASPERAPNQSAAPQPRQRSVPSWRVTTGNRRSLNRQEVPPSNRSQARSVIRPGQYGYGRVPSNFQLNGAMAHLLQTTPGRRHVADEGGSHQTAGSDTSSQRRWGASRVQRASEGQPEGSIEGRNWQVADGQASEAPVSSSPLIKPRQISFAKTLDPEEGDGPANSPHPEDHLSPEEPSRAVRRQRDLWPLTADETWSLRPTSQASRKLSFTSLDGPISWVLDTSESIRKVREDAVGGSAHRRRPRAQLPSQIDPQTRRRRHLSPELGPVTVQQRQEVIVRKGERRASPIAEFPLAKEGTLVWPAYNESSRPSLRVQAKGSKERRRNRQASGQRVSRPRRQNYGGLLDLGAESHQDWNPHQWPTVSCPGADKQYKTCSVSPCLSGETDPRKVQCARFNNLQFMGRYYKWEPFSEVRKEQRCELNCRPSGYRFYVRHSDRVQDGTPCEANSTDVCVGGQCLTAGCDGTLGSGTRPDRCGVCGGDGSSCELVFGLFEDSQVNVGYHRIISIPAGATRINITEAARSRNYLALRSHSGQSIINGNWAIDRPGQYEGAGTTFTYVRPSEGTVGERVHAMGPTTEPIEVYMIFQQDNPGIHYQFVLPVEKPTPPQPNPHLPSQTHTSSQSTGDLRDVSALSSIPALSHRGTHHTIPNPPRVRGGQRDRRLQVYHTDAQEDPALAPPIYRWMSQSLTECSVSCGKGFQYPTFRCLAQDTQELVSDALCDSASKPASVAQSCNTQPCPAFWSVGSWSQCSKSCGKGIYHRQVLCRQAYANRTVAVHPRHCAHLEKPNTTQPCETRPCTHWQIQTDWESCSVPCGVGQRKRSIRCVSNQGNVVGEGECSAKQKPTDSEACDMGPCVTSWFYTDWSNKCSVDCGLGIQKRSVVCLNNEIEEHSASSCEGLRPPDSRACTRPHCPRQVQWYASPWNECPVQCGNATQNRDLICVIKVGNNFTVMAPAECAHLEKPPSVQPCSAGACGPRWFTTDWSECSKSCMGGVQAREVRCLDDGGFPSNLCNEAQRPSDQRICHSHPCIPDLDENCKDKYYNCQVVVQARLCVYSYYKNVCCAACTHAERRTSDPRGRHAAGRGRGT